MLGLSKNAIFNRTFFFLYRLPASKDTLEACDSCRGAPGGGRAPSEDAAQTALGMSREETLRRIQATPEAARLTMQTFGVTDQFSCFHQNCGFDIQNT